MDKRTDDAVRAQRLSVLAESLSKLSDSQLTWIERVLKQFTLQPESYRKPDSDLVTPCVLEVFGDALQIHHCFSLHALSKDRFEHDLEAVLNRCMIPATLARKGNPGHDITINGVRFSLKTQAGQSIKEGFLHISKFMELGKGKWQTEEDLAGLRNSYLQHMNAYRRILQLRRLVNEETLQIYELVEIPKRLLQRASKGKLAMMNGSTQTPKPGTCTVADKKGMIVFQLYFDGGTERKLQIRHLDKRYCTVHATWKIARIPLSPEVT